MLFGMPTLIETPRIEDCIKLCSDLNLDFIELNNNFPWYQLDAIDPEKYLDLSRRYHLFYTIHLEEELNVCGYNKVVTEAYLATVLKSIELARELSVPVINMHLNSGIHITLPDHKVYLFQEYKELFLKKIMEFRQICEQAIGESEIKICIENAGGYMDFAREGIERLLESKVFALTFDIGHDHSAGGIDEPFIRAHKDRLMHMHLHDGLGKNNHLALGDGEINLIDKFALAKECKCRCVLETKTIEGLTKSVERLHHYFV
ncbi:MAG: xylose isomerase [Herbinix sp.]|jgi:sugar phosphate isomerase/epimerase|nr:xylose isomerase [Herbinix sp.]